MTGLYRPPMTGCLTHLKWAKKNQTDTGKCFDTKVRLLISLVLKHVNEPLLYRGTDVLQQFESCKNELKYPARCSSEQRNLKAHSCLVFTTCGFVAQLVVAPEKYLEARRSLNFFMLLLCNCLNSSPLEGFILCLSCLLFK